MARGPDGGRSSGSLPFDHEPSGTDGDWELLEPSRSATDGRGRWLWVAGLGLAAVLTAVAVGTGAGDDGAAPSGSSATVPPGAPSTTGGGPSTGAKSTFPFRTFGSGPVLGVEVGRRLVGVANRDGRWWLVDVHLDSGDTVRTPLPDFPGAGLSGLIPLADGTVVVWGAGTQPVVVSPGGGWRPILTQSYGPVLPGPDGGTLWWLDYTSSGPPILAQIRIDDGSTVASFARVPEFEVVGSDGAGGVLVAVFGQPTTWRVRPGGGVGPMPNVQGVVFAASPSVIVERRCDEDLSCSMVAHPPDRPDGVPLDLQGSADSWRSALSPDGRYLASFVPNADRMTATLRLVDLTTGASRVVASGGNDSSGRVAWIGPGWLAFGNGREVQVLQVDPPDSQPAPVTVAGAPLVMAAFTVADEPPTPG